MQSQDGPLCPKRLGQIRVDGTSRRNGRQKGVVRMEVTVKYEVTSWTKVASCENPHVSKTSGTKPADRRHGGLGGSASHKRRHLLPRDQSSVRRVRHGSGQFRRNTGSLCDANAKKEASFFEQIRCFLTIVDASWALCEILSFNSLTLRIWTSRFQRGLNGHCAFYGSR